MKVEFQGARVTSDGGLILVRELDERQGWGRCRCRAGSVARTRINTFWLQKTVSQGAVSVGAPCSPLNHCLRAHVRALEPAAGGDVQGSARKHELFAAAPRQIGNRDAGNLGSHTGERRYGGHADMDLKLNRLCWYFLGNYLDSATLASHNNPKCKSVSERSPFGYSRAYAY